MSGDIIEQVEQKFKLVSEYQPTGDQPAAIASLIDGLNNGVREQTLLGVTGSGKTFTMANIIADRQEVRLPAVTGLRNPNCNRPSP